MFSGFLIVATGSTAAYQSFNWVVTRGLVLPIPGKYLDGAERHKWGNAATALLSGIVMSMIVLYCLFNHPSFWGDPFTYYSLEADVAYAILLGYFAYDSVDLFRHYPLSRQFALLIHHAIMSFSLYILSYYHCIGILMLGLLSEISAVFLHSRIVMLMYGVSKESQVFKIHRLFNLVTFVGLRLTPLIYSVYGSFVLNGTVQLMPWYFLGSLPVLTISMTAINIVLFRRLITSDVLTKGAGTTSRDEIMDTS